MNKIKIRSKKSTSILDVSTTFLLRGIDSTDLIQRYTTGEFFTKNIPASKIQLVKAIKQFKREIGKDGDSEFYQMTDKLGGRHTIITINHKRYAHVTQEKNGEPPQIHCNWCKREIEDDPVGIPIRLEIDEIDNRLVFYLDDNFCTFACAYAHLLKFVSAHREHRDPNYMDAEQLLLLLYYELYPDGPKIKPSPDWRLYYGNGGPLSDEEYFTKTHKYRRALHVVGRPVKRLYEKLVITRR